NGRIGVSLSGRFSVSSSRWPADRAQSISREDPLSCEWPCGNSDGKPGDGLTSVPAHGGVAVGQEDGGSEAGTGSIRACRFRGYLRYLHALGSGDRLPKRQGFSPHFSQALTWNLKEIRRRDRKRPPGVAFRLCEESEMSTQRRPF